MTFTRTICQHLALTYLGTLRENFPDATSALTINVTRRNLDFPAIVISYQPALGRIYKGVVYNTTSHGILDPSRRLLQPSLYISITLQNRLLARQEPAPSSPALWKTALWLGTKIPLAMDLIWFSIYRLGRKRRYNGQLDDGSAMKPSNLIEPLAHYMCWKEETRKKIGIPNSPNPRQQSLFS